MGDGVDHWRHTWDHRDRGILVIEAGVVGYTL